LKPDPQKEKVLGNLFLIIEITLRNELAEKISEIILEVLQREYYKDPIKPADYVVIEHFEKALNKTNQALSTLASEGYVDWIDKTHIAIAAIKNNKIHFTHTGQVKVFLLRNQNLTHINQGPPEKPPTPIKTFTNITSGTLIDKDKLLLATPELFNYLPENEIKNALLNKIPLDTIKKIKELISSKDSTISVSAIAIDIVKEASSEKHSKSLPAFPKKIGQQKEKGLDINYPSLTLENPEASSETRDKETKIASSLKNNQTEKNSVPLVNKATNSFRLLFQKIKRRTSMEYQRPHHFRSAGKSMPKSIGYAALNLTKKILQALLIRFNNLPGSSKVLFVSSLVLTVLFIGSVLIIAQKKKEIRELNQHEILLEKALQKEKEASNALIYHDNERAKKLLLEAKEEAEKLIAAEILQAEAENLLEKIKAQLDKAEGITRIEDPIVLTELENKSIDKIVGLKETIYTFDKNTNLIYELDEENKKLATISEESSNLGYFKLAAINDLKDSMIFLTEAPSFAEFNLINKSIENLDVDIFNQDQETKDLSVYGDRLYRLVPEAKQIFKHTRTITGFSKGVEWVTSNTDDLENAQSIAIDGFIYVLKSDGKIFKYLRGTKKDFSVETPQEPVDSPSKIFTSEEIENLYVVDPNKKRVLVFNKNTGSLTAQFYSDHFDNLKDIYVNKGEKKMYILNGDKILGIVIDLKD
jgi:hypothetical protein